MLCRFLARRAGITGACDVLQASGQQMGANLLNDSIGVLLTGRFFAAANIDFVSQVQTSQYGGFCTDWVFLFNTVNRYSRQTRPIGSFQSLTVPLGENFQMAFQLVLGIQTEEPCHAICCNYADQK